MEYVLRQIKELEWPEIKKLSWRMERVQSKKIKCLSDSKDDRISIQITVEDILDLLLYCDVHNGIAENKDQMCHCKPLCSCHLCSVEPISEEKVEEALQFIKKYAVK